MSLTTLEEWADDLERRLIKVTNAAAEELKNSMSNLTPRDTGRAANGYFVIQATSTTPAIIRNEVPYIMFLNDGTPKYFGDNFVQISIQRFNKNLNRFDT